MEFSVSRGTPLDFPAHSQDPNQAQLGENWGAGEPRAF